MATYTKIKGKVVGGKKLGRELGFPTANIPVSENCYVDSGVYAVKVEVDGNSYYGMANIGYKPSVEKSSRERFLEVNIFDFKSDLYGKDIEVALLKYIRPEMKFESLGDLKSAIENDRRKIKEFLKNE